MESHHRTAHVLFGSIVTLLTVPSGIGPAIGGWVAARRTASPTTGAVTAGFAGLIGTLPWAGLVYLATAGAIEPIGYHEGLVHVGVNTAAAETFVLWQEVGLTALVAGIVVSTAVLGGIVAGLDVDVAGELREEVVRARDAFDNGA
jgi:MFS family permease